MKLPLRFAEDELASSLSVRWSTTALAVAGCALFAALPAAQAQHFFLQTNLVADVPGVAPVTDPNLVNPWGLSRSATSFWWAADNGTGVSTLYSGLGVRQALVMTVPPAAGLTGPSTPTGTVFNGSSDFQVGPNQPARFLFVTEEGTLSGWNPAANATNSITKVDNSGKAVYKGMALGQIAGLNRLYLANFHSGAVEVYDQAFAPVNLGAWAFRDPKLPKGYAPFNVQAIGDKIYVAYAKQDKEKIDEVAGRGRGYVNVYTTSGELTLRLHKGPWFNAPWGLAQAPADFGQYSNMILVGQFGSGKIAAFDPVTGKFKGLVRTADRRVLKIDGLWALAFGNGANAGPLTSLYFTAGTGGEAHGLFGTITSLIDPVRPDDHHDCDDDDDDEHDDDRGHD